MALHGEVRLLEVAQPYAPRTLKVGSKQISRPGKSFNFCEDLLGVGKAIVVNGLASHGGDAPPRVSPSKTVSPPAHRLRPIVGLVIQDSPAFGNRRQMVGLNSGVRCMLLLLVGFGSTREGIR